MYVGLALPGISNTCLQLWLCMLRQVYGFKATATSSMKLCRLWAVFYGPGEGSTDLMASVGQTYVRNGGPCWLAGHCKVPGRADLAGAGQIC